MTDDATTASHGAAPMQSSGVQPDMKPRRSSAATIVALVLVAFIGGMIVTLFGPQLAERWMPQTALSSSPPPIDVPKNLIQPQDVSTLEGRVAALSARIDALSAQAQNAGSFASRAESLMVAFAVRRALDNGVTLGYLESELRARFGEAQPKAVATIISAAQDPVTLSDLQAGLDDSAAELIGGPSTDNWWTATRRELGNLVILRRAGSPSRIPQKALQQARAVLTAGRVDAAIREVERIPGHQKVESWLERARRYNEARRALDIIEAAAILEPRVMPVPSVGTAATPESVPESQATEPLSSAPDQP